MSTQIARIGKTIAVEIPEELLLRANLSVGDNVNWTVTETGQVALRGSRTQGIHGVRRPMRAGKRGRSSPGWRRSTKARAYLTKKRSSG